MQKGKWLPEEDLQIAEKTREAKGKGENEDISERKYILGINCLY